MVPVWLSSQNFITSNFHCNRIDFQACFSLSEPSFNELPDDMIIG